MDMREKNIRNRRVLRFLSIWVMVGLFLLCPDKLNVHAQEYAFEIEAVKLPMDEETYNIQLNIENLGSDWEGTVRLVVDEEYRMPTAYDTMLSLPQGSTKQFMVKVPLDSMEDTDGTIKVTLWDKKSEKSAEKEFKRFLSDGADALYMGILSDDYASLTYLDLGGSELYFYGDDYPIKLVDMTQKDLQDSLETIDFLVIDTYNTDVLTEDDLKAIELWNYDGGVLIVGTGSYAEDTLAGFEDSYLDMKYGTVYAPGEANYLYSDVVDLSQVAIAELYSMGNMYYEQYFTNAMSCGIGDGAIGILPYSLSDLAKVDSSFYQNVDQNTYALNILDGISGDASTRYNRTGYNYNYSNINYLSRMLRMIGSVNSPLKFGVLKFIVIAYVVFVGPLLYLLLRFLKKRELYWVAVPVSALLGILLIFFAGRGFEVVNTRVYSVTAENLERSSEGKTFLYCFDAKNKEWGLKLTDNYDYAGALMNGKYFYDEQEDVYYHHIQKAGDGFTFGIKPSANFEDSFFYAGVSETGRRSSGTIDVTMNSDDWFSNNLTVTNNTNKDFKYYAVIFDGTLYVYENLPVGESCNLQYTTPIYSGYQQYDVTHDYMYNFLNNEREDMEEEEVSALGALGVGLCEAYSDETVDNVIIVGVTENWDKVVEDDCSELSYGCVYVVK